MEHPILADLQSDLYANFMERTWRNRNEIGISGLVHPARHLTDPKGGRLRVETYERLRRHFQFRNEALLFEEVDHNKPFAVNIYGARKEVHFLYMAHMQLVETINESLRHNGDGEPPGIKTPWGDWDRRPHRARVLYVTERELSDWALLFDDIETPPKQARIAQLVTSYESGVISTLIETTDRMRHYGFSWTRGFDEDKAKRDGDIAWATGIPQSWSDVVLQGPQIGVATPLSKQPNENCKNKMDYSDWDLEDLPEAVIPRTNYQRATSKDRYLGDLDTWDGQPNTESWRTIWKNMVNSGHERTLQAALIPPGPTHVNVLHSLRMRSRKETALVAGLWSSMPLDYIIKVSGQGHVYAELVGELPAPMSHPATLPLLLRTLRLNCLIRRYAALWEDLFIGSFREDAWTPSFSHRPALQAVDQKWTMATPLRTDYDRRAALVESDALVAIMLGLTADQLCAICRAQFPVLRKYEYRMYFDAQGRKIAKDHQTYGAKQEKGDYELVEAWVEEPGSVELPDRYQPPFTKPDREAEMRAAYAEFERRLAAGGV